MDMIVGVMTLIYSSALLFISILLWLKIVPAKMSNWDGSLRPRAAIYALRIVYTLIIGALFVLTLSLLYLMGIIP
jgi:hypothetical protein